MVLSKEQNEKRQEDMTNFKTTKKMTRKFHNYKSDLP